MRIDRTVDRATSRLRTIVTPMCQAVLSLRRHGDTSWATSLSHRQAGGAHLSDSDVLREKAHPHANGGAGSAPTRLAVAIKRRQRLPHRRHPHPHLQSRAVA